MSTILNALKQAEKESRQHAPNLSFNSSTTNGFHVSERAKQYIPQPVLFIFITLFAAGLCVACFYYLFKNNTVPPVAAPETEKKVNRQLKNTVPPVMDHHHQSVPQSVTAGHLEEKRGTYHVPQNAVAAQSLPSSPPPPPIRPKTIKTQPKPEGITEIIPNPADTEPDHPIQSDIPIMEDRSLKIQAISWDHTPENRITIINNNILHEGDLFQDLYIVKIEKAAVILNKNGNEFLLKFDYRQ